MNKADTNKTQKTKILTQKKSTLNSFPIVGIGASAGGLEALEQFFSGMPKNSGMAFVVVQHLDPSHTGVMPELLQRATSMKVTQVTDHLKVKPDNVYVIPPNKSLSLLNGYLHLFDPTESRGLRLPIDIFFHSLADDRQETSIGIILSGMGSDGSKGLRAIKEKNGIVLVQDPLTSKFDGMPKSAIESVSADIIASAKELPGKLISFLKFTPVTSKDIAIDDKNKTNLEKIVILLRTQTGHDFSFYKKNTLYRRIERRMGIHQIDKIDSYVHFLQQNPKELEILFKELLIGVTNFFRDPALWDMLRDHILPELFKELPAGYVLRVWINGCSTGEEAYSLAIVFKEAYIKTGQSNNLTLQIFATDIDKDAIDIARRGVYGSVIEADVSSARRAQFFKPEENRYSVNTSIREMVLFATHDVIKDPPFTKLDMLFCRNLLIYLESDLQRKLMNLFYYSLNAGGIMVLGTSETISCQEKLFSAIDTKFKVFRRNIEEAVIERMDFPSSFSHSSIRLQKEIVSVTSSINIQTFADQLILQRFAPASVLINKDGDILYITGKTGKYLEPAAGKANMNIYAMAREGLRNELAGAIRKAKQSYEPVNLLNVEIRNGLGKHLVNVTLQSTESPEAFKGTIMIVFKDVPAVSKSHEENQNTGESKANFYIHESQIALQNTLDELHSTREEMRASQEELNLTNEELRSANEELQSTNEELTTSKEEMQSLNEELQTINIELQTKVNDYLVANNDMKNLLNSTEIATLFLDKELNIRRFTDQLTSLIKLRPIDTGRPFTDMVSDLKYPKIADDAKEVLRTLIYKESDISTNDQKWYRVRIMPYRTLDDKIEGLVITFIDITSTKTLENELKKAINVLREHNLLTS